MFVSVCIYIIIYRDIYQATHSKFDKTSLRFYDKFGDIS